MFDTGDAGGAVPAGSGPGLVAALEGLVAALEGLVAALEGLVAADLETGTTQPTSGDKRHRPRRMTAPTVTRRDRRPGRTYGWPAGQPGRRPAMA